MQMAPVLLLALLALAATTGVRARLVISAIEVRRQLVPRGYEDAQCGDEATVIVTCTDHHTQLPDRYALFSSCCRASETGRICGGRAG